MPFLQPPDLPVMDSGNERATMILQRENAVLRQELAAVKAIDEEEFARLYSQMGETMTLPMFRSLEIICSQLCLPSI